MDCRIWIFCVEKDDKINLINRSIENQSTNPKQFKSSPLLTFLSSTLLDIWYLDQRICVNEYADPQWSVTNELIRVWTSCNFGCFLPVRDMTCSRYSQFWPQIITQHAFTGNGNVPIWWHFHHWLHSKLSNWQLSLQPVIYIVSVHRHLVPEVLCHL